MADYFGFGVEDVFFILRGVRDAVRKVKRKPSVADRDRIAEYLRFISERRVLSVDFNVEVVECCIASLESLLKATEECLAQVTHDAARAALGGILDILRRFLDRWRGFTTPRRGPPWEADDRPWHVRGEKEAAFFHDLGQLRVGVLQMVDILAELDPKLTFPALFGARPSKRDA